MGPGFIFDACQKTLSGIIKLLEDARSDCQWVLCTIGAFHEVQSALPALVGYGAHAFANRYQLVCAKLRVALT